MLKTKLKYNCFLFHVVCQRRSKATVFYHVRHHDILSYTFSTWSNPKKNKEKSFIFDFLLLLNSSITIKKKILIFSCFLFPLLLFKSIFVSNYRYESSGFADDNYMWECAITLIISSFCLEREQRVQVVS